jgi:hypothetical protein
LAFCLFLDDQAGLQDRPDSFPELDRCAQIPRHRRARPAVTCRAGVLFSKPERFNEKWGARPSRSLQSASRRLVFADERWTKQFSQVAAESLRPEAENRGRAARAPQINCIVPAWDDSSTTKNIRLNQAPRQRMKSAN